MTKQPQTIAPEVVAILNEQEMRGERVVNHIRTGFFTLSLLTLLGTWSANTHEANVAFVVQIVSALGYAAMLHLWFWKNKNRYAPVLKYVSITVDLVLLHMAAIIMAANTSGVIEYFFSVVPIVLVMWNMLAALRHSVAACLYSAGMTGLLSAVVLWWVLNGGDAGAALVPFNDTKADYNNGVIGVPDEITRVVFTVITGAVSAAVAWTSRHLIIRAEEESHLRYDLEQQKSRLSKYLGGELADVVAAGGGVLDQQGSQRVATILFTDIRNFTALSAGTEPEEIVSLLNAYFSEMVEIVFRYGGTLDKFLGDGLMAVFGAPFQRPLSPLRTVLTSIEMVAAVDRFNDRLKPVSQSISLKIGAGIATGDVIAGNIGSDERMEYTVIGDAVNLAARLEALNRPLGTTIIIDAATKDAVAPWLPATPLPPTKVAGLSGEQRLYRVDPATISQARLAELRAMVLDGSPATQLVDAERVAEAVTD